MNLLIFNLRQDADDGVLGFTTDWVNALARRCDRIVVITMAKGALRLEPNVTVYSVGTEKGHGKLRRGAAFYRLLWKALRERQIDACFAHMNYLFALLGAPLLKMWRVPILLWYAHKSVTPSLRVTEKLVDAVVASSASGFQLPSRKLTVIGQGIDTDSFVPPDTSPQADERLRLLSFGRISRIKRLEVILESLARLRAIAPQLNFECRIVGDPLDDDGVAYLQELQTRATLLNLDRYVHFSRGVPFHQARLIFAAADIFLNPGDTDSVDKTVLEGMSCGVPVITSNAAFQEILPADIKQHSVVPKNDPDAFAHAIARMAQWPAEQRRAFGLRGRAVVVEEHSLERLADKLMAQLLMLVERKHDMGNERSA